jgi:hypothetical protein
MYLKILRIKKQFQSNFHEEFIISVIISYHIHNN